MEYCGRFWDPQYKRDIGVLERPMKGHRNDEETEASHIWGRAKRTRTLQPRKGSGWISSMSINI